MACPWLLTFESGLTRYLRQGAWSRVGVQSRAETTQLLLHLREAVLISGDFAASDVPPQPPPTTAVGLLRCERRDGLNVNRHP